MRLFFEIEAGIQGTLQRAQGFSPPKETLSMFCGRLLLLLVVIQARDRTEGEIVNGQIREKAACRSFLVRLLWVLEEILLLPR